MKIYSKLKLKTGLILLGIISFFGSCSEGNKSDNKKKTGDEEIEHVTCYDTVVVTDTVENNDTIEVKE